MAKIETKTIIPDPVPCEKVIVMTLSEDEFKELAWAAYTVFSSSHSLTQAILGLATNETSDDPEGIFISKQPERRQNLLAGFLRDR
jgi:hypothetical protein